MTLLLKSAKIISPKSTYHNSVLDVLIENGKIKTIGEDLPCEKNTKKIQRDNLHISLGWFDSSVCFGEPGYEERETISNGLLVAAKSGFTSILLNPNTNPVPDTGTHISALLSKSKKGIPTLHPIGAMTQRGKGQHLAELFDMQTSGAVAFGDFKTSIKDASLLKTALLYTQNFDGLILSYPQEDSLFGKGLVNEGPNALSVGLRGVPSLSEKIQIARDLSILRYTGGRLHIPTISTKEALLLIKQAKTEGLNISCSVSIHHLAYSDRKIIDFDTNYKVLPPLRLEEDMLALREGVLEGVIDLVTTDHTPVNIEHKQHEFENAMYGTTGLESAFGVLNSLFGLEKAIDLLTKGRSIFKIDEPKLLEGKEVNLTLFDPNPESLFQIEDIKSTSKNSAFIGHAVRGKIYGVFRGDRSLIDEASL